MTGYLLQYGIVWVGVCNLLYSLILREIN